MMMENPNRLYESFLETFPRERLEHLTLEEYTNLNRADSFCYWLENKTNDLGSISGGSSYKFGIFRRDPSHKREDNRPRYLSNDTYAWVAKYGNTPEEAFETIRHYVLQIANAVSTGRFEEIDAVDLGDAYKWKIAFLYARQGLIGIFNPDIIRRVARELGLQDAKQQPVSAVQRFLITRKEAEKDIFTYGSELWNLAQTLRKTWLYAPGNNAFMWDELYAAEEMAIGWGELGDLRKYGSREKIEEQLKEYYPQTKEDGRKVEQTNNSRTIYDFCRTMSEGDKIIVRRGQHKILGIGEVESGYYYDETKPEYAHRRKVKWLLRGEWDHTKNFPQKTLTDITDFDYTEKIITMLNTADWQKDLLSLLQERKQLILQGAPGTGKTYLTTELAVRLCCPDVVYNSREKLMAEYVRLKNEGRIAFTVFHQSLDYEEFVEGLKPVRENGTATFAVKNGLFKTICETALLDMLDLSKESAKELEFDDIFDGLCERVRSENLSELPLKNGGKILLVGISDEGNLRFKHENAERKYIVSKDRLRRLYQEFDTKEKLDRVQNIDVEFRRVIGGCNSSGYWAALNYVIGHRSVSESQPIDPDDLTDEEKKRLIRMQLLKPVSQRTCKPECKNFVLIIDEINRGNISKILGELISLLEADKRFGAPNELTAVLPYSQSHFAVPANLFIIGTMNTADRSVGYIDYAIRRRFAFYPLTADMQKIERFYDTNSLSEDLKTEALHCFKEVENLVNEHLSHEFSMNDLMIGHSYFMARSLDELRHKMRFEVRPLLLEYINDGILTVKRSDEKVYKIIENLGADVVDIA